jgi:ribonuclease HI
MKVYTDASQKVLCYVTPTKTHIEPHFYKTTNEAEYAAVLLALASLSGSLEVFTDSELVANQINGVYSVKSERMARMMLMYRDTVGSACRIVTVTWVPREENLAGIAIEKWEKRG